MTDLLHGPWLLGAALLCLVGALRRAPRPAAAEVGWPAGMVLAGALARYLWGLWGPLHVNGQGPLWIRGTLDLEALGGYGPGYFELFNWMVRSAGGMPDRTVFAANVLLSALSPALLYAVARLIGVARGGALAAALVLAAAPVNVYTAASETYQSALIALVLAVQVALALVGRAQARGDTLGRNLAVLAAGLLAAAAARIHPMAYLPLALSPLLVLLAARPDSWKSRLALTAASVAVIGAIALLTSGDVILTALRASPMTEHVLGGMSRRDYQLLLALLAIAALLHRWLTWLPLFGIGSLALLLATEGSFNQHPLWRLWYQHLYVPGILLGAAPLLPRRLSPGWALPAGGAVAAALLASAWPYLGIPTTEQLEYRFLRDILRDMPPGCTLAAVSRSGRRVWEIPSYLIAGGGPGGSAQRSVRDASDLAAVAPGDCLVYVRSSLCSSDEGRALCDAVETGGQLERVAGHVFPAAPSYTDLPYDRSAVDVAVFRVSGAVTRPTQARIGPDAVITPAVAQALYERLTPLREADGCTLARLDTRRLQITVELTTRAGNRHSFELSTTAGGGAGRTVGAWTLAVPPEVERDCGATLAAIEGVLAETGQGAARHTPRAGDPQLAGRSIGARLSLNPWSFYIPRS